MLTKVRMYNESGDYAEMPLGVDPDVGGYSVRKVDGLGPVKADIAYSDYVLLPGGVFNSANTGVRNLVYTISYNPNYAENQTVQDMRSDLYVVAPPGELVKMYFYDDGTWRYWTEGRVETHDPDIFSSEPTAVISVLCIEMPTFADPNNAHLNGTTGVGINVPYAGTAPRGFIVEAVLGAAVDWFQVRKTMSGGNAAVVINRSMPSGTRLRLQLEQGFKQISIVDSSGDILQNLLGDLTVVKEWPQLKLGDNSILVSQSSGSSTFELTYRNHYVGI